MLLVSLVVLFDAIVMIASSFISFELCMFFFHLLGIIEIIIYCAYFYEFE